MQLKASRFLSSEPITSNEAQTILSSKFNSILTDFKFLSSDKSNNKLNSGVHIFRINYLNKVCSNCQCALQDDCDFTDFKRLSHVFLSLRSQTRISLYTLKGSFTPSENHR